MQGFIQNLKFGGKLTTLENLFALAALKSKEDAHKPPPPPKPLKYGEIKMDTPVYFSFLALDNLHDPADPRWPPPESTQNENIKFDGRSLRLNNNKLENLDQLAEFTTRYFTNPISLGWLDLSFNQLEDIGWEILQFKNLHILYLHGNKIKELSEVDKLAELPKLRKLTLHGNPLEEAKGCKMYVRATLPQVKNFSFSAVTKCEAATAISWKRMNSPDNKRKKGKKDNN